MMVYRIVELVGLILSVVVKKLPIIGEIRCENNRMIRSPDNMLLFLWFQFLRIERGSHCTPSFLAAFSVFKCTCEPESNITRTLDSLPSVETKFIALLNST